MQVSVLRLSRAKLFFIFVYILLIGLYSQKFDIIISLFKTKPKSVFAADFHPKK